jgi:hypothetical protein
MWLTYACSGRIRPHGAAVGKRMDGETPAMDTKKLLGLVVVVFLGFWMFTDPNGLAETAKTAGSNGWDLTAQAFGGLIDFIGALGKD